MRIALRDAGVSVGEMADYLELNRNTLGGWMNGRHRPSTGVLRLWALRCGVPFEWLKTGRYPATDHKADRIAPVIPLFQPGPIPTDEGAEA